ncbi:DUF1801 domain-containing protein [Mucilaginibacter sp. AW1-3]
MTPLEEFYSNQPEPIKSCLLALRDIILAQDKDVTAAWKYGMPFFCYKGKMFCYLWVHKKHHQPYIGIVEGKHIEHPNLIQEDRARMKTMLFDASRDLPVDTIQDILQQAIALYTSGKIRLKS